MQSLMSSLFFTVAPFTVAAAASRWLFQLTHSRLQIAVFVALAAMIELSAGDLGYRANWWRFALNAIGATCAIIAVRFHLEGLPPWAEAWFTRKDR